ncbi:MAG TPA: hypothetical protein VJM80_03115 [bacterium]|nr:hypothetical protein [bacterium]
MCDFDGGTYRMAPEGRPGSGPTVMSLDDLVSYARVVADGTEWRSPNVGFIGYGQTKKGDRVLLAVDTHYDHRVVEAFARALRDKGAKVDIMTVDAGPNREFEDLDEIKVVMRRRHWREEPRRWEGIPWIEELAHTQKYDLLIHGKGGPTPATDHRYEQVPWLIPAHLGSGSTTFPRALHQFINEKTWSKIWNQGRGGKVHLSDAEGTDLTFTLLEEYYGGDRRGYNEAPQGWYGHLLGHAPPPFIEKEDATGVVAGTTSHYARPFERIKVHVERGRVERIEGGGHYGEAWRELWEEGMKTHYPCFPRPGLFWVWEMAIGTNPKVVRPPNIHELNSGGFEWERRRSGVMHVGFGTRWRGPEEEWAAERGILFGHLHVHLLFTSYRITTKRGEEIPVIENGRLSALDDPEVREFASKFGDPDQLLSEEWIPNIPGINAGGSYDDFARDPAKFIYPKG